MKKKYLILIYLIFIAVTNYLYAQEYQSGKLFVAVTDIEAVPDIQLINGRAEITLNDSGLRSLLSQYEVYEFERTYTACIDSIVKPHKYSLERIYRLSMHGDEAGLMTELNQNYSHYYDLAERIPEKQLLYTPNDYHLLDGTLGPNWALDVVYAKQAWDITKGDSSVIIGIPDAGFNLNHEDLVNKVKLTYGGSEIPGGHGTAVAGAAAGDTDNSTGMSSIGFNSSLAVGYMDYERVCQMAVDGIKIINTSWNQGGTQTHDSLLHLIRDMGTLVVSAAGNGTEQFPNNPTGYRFPASHESTLAVTSIGPNLNHLHIKPNGDTMFHTHHDMIDICAPGYGIIVPWEGSSNSNYIIGWGSSYASPMVAGLAGLLLSLDPDLSPAELKAVIKATAQPVSDAHLFPEGHLGAGVINAYAAVDFIANCAPTIIGVNTIWDKDQTFFCDIIVEEGAVLEVYSDLKFGKNAKVIVKRGGHLILDGAKLSFVEKDRGLWPGIEVWGTYNESQFPSGNQHQGKITMRNGATIENARTGILAGKAVKPYEDKGIGVPIPLNAQYNGGILSIDQASFVNNKISIYWPPYENRNPIDQSIINNVGFVFNSDFIYNAPSNAEIDTEVFIMLNGVRGIRTIGNHFYGNEQTGILSLNADFTVKASCLDEFVPCQNYRLSTFNNLRYGVRALGSASGKTFSVDTAVFNNTLTSVYTSQVDHFSITRSQFNVLPSGQAPDHLGGIYVDGNALGFQIEENHFTGNYLPGPFGGPLHIGITFNQSGPFANELYNNTFAQLNIATLAMNQNRDQLGTVGLCIKCNTYAGNEYDIVANYDEQQYAWGGIATHQGSSAAAPDAPAGNRFSHAGDANTPTDINNQGGPIYYYYHAGPNADPKLEPLYFTGVTPVAGDPVAIWDPELSCPSNLNPPDGGHDEEALRGMMEEAEQEAGATQNLIGILKDAGDTEALHWDVNMSAPWQGMEVYSELMSVGPYVSDTVLAAAIEKENVLVDAMIRDVLVANPHSAKSEALMHKLEQRVQPLPEYMLDEILQGQSLVSVYEKLQADLSQQKQKQAVYQKQLVQLYLNDTLQPASSADSLVNLLLASSHSAPWYRAAYIRHEQGDSTASALILNSIPASFGLSGEQLQSHYHLQALLEQENLLHSEGKSLSVPDSTTVEWLFELMETAGVPAAIYARNILLAHGLLEHQPQYLLPGDTKSEPVKRPHSQKPPKKEALKLSPNPANEYVIIAFDVDEQIDYEGSGNIKVSTINGKLIESLPLTQQKDQLVFPLKGYKPGAYVFSLYFNNQLLESKRLIIQ
jgi:hypothetical protein